MNKRGQEELLYFVIYILIAILILGALLYFVRGTATGRLVRTQVLAKELALFVDAAQPGTVLELSHENALIKLDEKTKEIVVRIGESVYSYDYFNPHRISLESNGTTTKIKIEK